MPKFGHPLKHPIGSPLMLLMALREVNKELIRYLQQTKKVSLLIGWLTQELLENLALSIFGEELILLFQCKAPN